ncbi:hypothetical protein FACS1894188_05470 [Clostridia bacterium]|nr:hypothetical protein FACS1894188_05470 [Clostridia bacterium]
MKYTLTKTSICLGYSALTDWESLLIDEAVVDEYNDVFSDNFDENDKKDFDGFCFVEDARLQKSRNRDFLLFAMLLFDNVTTTNLSKYKLDRLIDCGIVQEDTFYMPSISMFDKTGDGIYQLKPEFVTIKQSAEIIMRNNKKAVLTAIKRREFLSDWVMKKYPLLRDDQVYFWITESDDTLQNISRHFCKLIKDCENWEHDNDVNDLLGIVKTGIMNGLYESQMHNSVFFDGSIASVNPNINSNTKSQIDSENIRNIMALDLSSFLYHLPIPHSFPEVLEYRKNPNITVFREHFFRWCSSIKTGDINEISIIKKDVELAESKLEKYYKWENSKTKWFKCIIDVALAEIPYISNILGAFAPFSTKSILKSRQENSWILIGR